MELKIKLQELSRNLQDLNGQISELCKLLEVKQDNEAEDAVSTKVDLETIRACLAELLHEGKREQIVELLGKYGASCLSDVPEEHYSALLKDAEGLKNA